MCDYLQHVLYLDKEISEQSNYVLDKDGEVTNEREQRSSLDGQMTSLSSVAHQTQAQKATDKDKLEAF